MVNELSVHPSRAWIRARALAERAGHPHPLVAGILGAVLLGTPTVMAFDGPEHRTVSRDALCLALDFMGQPLCPELRKDPGPSATKPSLSACPLQLTAQDQLNLDLLLSETSSNLSYADFVVFVDFVLDPIKLLERDSSIQGLPRWPKDLNEDFLFRLRSRPTLHAWAAQNNDSHFQQQMMMSWWLWHRNALLAASVRNAVGEAPVSDQDPRRLFAALLMEAISNHYLEDFFAPGHVIPPREGMQDYSAVSMHDYYNRTGAPFEIDLDHWPDLARLLDPERQAKLLDIDETFLTELKNNGPGAREHHFHGDGYLLPSSRKQRAHPGLVDEATMQRIFVTLVMARSIVDVLESYGCESPRNHFPDYRWSPLRRPDKGGLILPAGGMAYGQYVEQKVKRIEYGLLTTLEASFQSTPWSQVENARSVVSLVWIPSRLGPPPGRLVDGVYVPRHGAYIGSVGINYRIDEELSGYGAFVRGTILSPRLDLSLGLGLGVERYTWDAHEAYRFRPEARVGVGASLVTVFGGVGYDYDLDDERQLRGEVTLRAGIAIGIPWSRIPR